MLDVRRLEVLKAVVDRGSFSAAAEHLNFTQPAISRQIAALEREAGARLLERDARGTRLTQAGELLLEHAGPILSKVAAAEAQLTALQQLETGRLRLTGFASANSFLVPHAITRFTAIHPKIELTLTSAQTVTALAALSEGDIDLGLISDIDRREQSQVEGLEFEHLLDDEIHLVVPATHRLAARSKGTVRLRDLEDEVWIEGDDAGWVGPLERVIRLGGFEPRVGFRVGEWLGKQGLVAAGVGVMLIPSLALSTLREDVCLRRIAPALPPRGIYAAYPSGGYEPPARAPMLEALHAAAADHRDTAAAILERAGIPAR